MSARKWRLVNFFASRYEPQSASGTAQRNSPVINSEEFAPVSNEPNPM